MKDNQAKYPQLRFKGFTDPWVQRQVGDFLTESRIPGSNGAISKKLTVKLWGKGVIPKETVTDGSEATKYYVRKAGQFMYGKLDFLHAAFGIVPENLDGYESTLDSPAFDIANLNSTFLMDTVMRKSFYLYQGNIANGSRKAKRIHVDTFSDMPIDVPTLDEQDKIGYFFDQLDNLIAANQRKLDLLKEQKKGYLQKMFPKNGAKVPELRFAGFADDWEVRKLKDVLDISKTKNKAQQYGKVDVLSVSREVGTVNQIKYQGRSFAGSDLSNYKVVQGGELIYTKSPLKGAPYGIFQVATIKGILSPLYAVYTSTDKAYTPFVAMALKNDNIATHYLTPLVTKGAKNTINVTDEGALEGKIQFPSILEQKQIFIFFKQLDDTIALHQRKLEKLQELKKGYLQKMFC
ncbi:restriction endonuclease subunit S [Lactiplantibacillus plantarum]|uniref:restriction endonuclease subunit S n=1 Tax=Lactiplantibacillus plantarum TaxID=1590 RepID=UPI0010C3274B|nr:restriction endonuclease subunit S [Lactiplantibacillus plantarum]MCG0866258.1 restriction endonuclease subunit S [Lactiplantibacillus plantarum]MCG0909225.1 restriction endonuclease subunit S [Lactiplantibacillus plantarum]QBZ20594.1 restriction endonuclease subunit S [Lactiplantibacillus plantarum]